MNPPYRVSRRRFLQTASLATLAAGLAPGSFAAQLGTPAPFRNLVTGGRKLRVACIGVGGQGWEDVRGVSGEEIIALCDVDFGRAREAIALHPRARRYHDYRRMFAELGDQIDAVTIATPDHMHFPAALLALELGKHVRVQKPLTHTIEEARILKSAAQRAGVVTQMGNQGHANEGTRLVKEWIDAGVIGAVREVHLWTNRPAWPQDGQPAPVDDFPATLDWNLWLGVAPERTAGGRTAPADWRNQWDFGSGTLGDMGCHLLDAAFWALDLRGDLRVTATSEGGTDTRCPHSAQVTYDFPRRGDRPPVRIVWFDCHRRPPAPRELGPGATLPAAGALYYGEDGLIAAFDDYHTAPRLLPDERMRAFTRPARRLPRVPGADSYREWIDACKGRGPAPGSSFADHACDLTELVLLGTVAIRAGHPIDWDARHMACRGQPEADRLLRKSYRVY